MNLRSLLVEACKVIDQYYPELMPRRVRVWWTAQKLTARRASGNDSAMIGRLMDEMRERVERDD
jgi:hypothetical protein